MGESNPFGAPLMEAEVEKRVTRCRCVRWVWISLFIQIVGFALIINTPIAVECLFWIIWQNGR